MKAEELIKFQNENYAWSSKDTSVIAIEGNKVIPKKEGSVVVVATTDKGDEVRLPIRVVETISLIDNAKVGDYVAYDAGTWVSSVASPTVKDNWGLYSWSK